MSTKFKNVPFGTEVPEITKSDAGNNIIALKDFTVDFTGATVCGRFDFTCATILGGQIVLDTSCGGVHLKAGDSDLLLNADNIQKIKDAAGIS